MFAEVTEEGHPTHSASSIPTAGNDASDATTFTAMLKDKYAATPEQFFRKLRHKGMVVDWALVALGDPDEITERRTEWAKRDAFADAKAKEDAA